MKYVTVHEWLEVCRGLIKHDLDNVMLFTGDEGSGKSTLAFQVCRALDSTFDETRCTFNIRDFIDLGQALPKGCAVDGDEMLANSRKGMWAETVELLDFLQICRGLNLHIAVCFPHPDLLDKAIRDHRVRYWIHVPRRGLAYLRERATSMGSDGTIYNYWRLIARFTFGKNSGPLWERYQEKKAANMRAKIDPEGEDALQQTWDVDELRKMREELEAREAAKRGKVKL